MIYTSGYDVRPIGSPSCEGPSVFLSFEYFQRLAPDQQALSQERV